MATNSKGNSITKTVSMDVEMGKNAEERAKRLGLRSFSAYVQNLIRSDLMGGGDLLLKEDADVPKPTDVPIVAGIRSPIKYPPLKRKGEYPFTTSSREKH